MNRTRLGIVTGGLFLLFTAIMWGLVYSWAKTVPTSLEGDPWDYAISPDDVPAGWSLAQQTIATPFDVAQSVLTTTIPLTDAASLQTMTLMYTASYQAPKDSEYADLTCRVTMFQNDLDVRTILAAENPGAGWESAPPPNVGDAARLWHFTSSDLSAREDSYRVDFRYINGLASVTLKGSPKALPDSTEAAAYARKVLDKMEKTTTPPGLKSLRSAGLGDLRRYLLTQDQVAQGDSYLGNRWVVAADPLPGWTLNSSLSPEDQQALAPLERVTGYQMYFRKSLSQAELKGAIPVLLYQQVTAYTQVANAQQALDMMQGTPQLEQAPNPPQIGDGQARGWQGEIPITQGDGAKGTAAVYELDFQVGNYVASVRVQSRPLDDSEISHSDKSTSMVTEGTGLLQIAQVTEAYAKILAENLQQAVR